MTVAAAADQISLMLREVGVDVVSAKANTWLTRFIVDGDEQHVVLFVPQPGDYFVALAPIVSARLNQPLDTLSPEVLRKFIGVSSEIPFAKVEYFISADGFHYAATSECSIEGVTGAKLRRRLEACATLAQRLTRWLMVAPPWA